MLKELEKVHAACAPITYVRTSLLFTSISVDNFSSVENFSSSKGTGLGLRCWEVLEKVPAACAPVTCVWNFVSVTFFLSASDFFNLQMGQGGCARGAAAGQRESPRSLRTRLSCIA